MDKDGLTARSAQTFVLAEHFATSEKFDELFSYGMDLVEQTATFLDSEGREAAKDMDKRSAALYGTESMRLTTRLMQLASWLLLQRAVAEGEMTTAQASAENRAVKINQLPSRIIGPVWDAMPENFIDLVERSIALQTRIKRLDDQIYGKETAASSSKPSNPVASQHLLLETAFDRRFQV